MKTKSAYLLCFLAVGLMTFIIGCSTAYRPYGFNGGYSDRQIGSNTFRISFMGNGSTTEKKAHDFTLLRAAEITLEHGFSYFNILENKNIVLISPDNLAAALYYDKLNKTSTNLHEADKNTPTRIAATKRPTCDMLIRCYHEKPANTQSADAASMRDAIRRNYQLKPKVKE